MSDEAIRALVEQNPGQATQDEYRLVHDTIAAVAPCRLLVFGVGLDSKLWLAANHGGRTAFVEDSSDWAERARAQTPGIEIHPVRYRTIRALWRPLVRLDALLRMRDLPPDVVATRWDVVFVDGPRGTRWYRPGRMKSIYTAAQLAGREASREPAEKPSASTAGGVRTASAPPEAEATGRRYVDVLIHDCNRRVERECCERFFRAETLVRQVGSMRHYRVG